ncbi:MAG: hypothetical protein JRC92_11395 [Deltaproteobacteria bacterium]|nr:hypothetical protein [Deltaproteobacteria bacterium]
MEIWPTEEEIEAERRAAWQALSAEERLDFLEHFISGLLAAREKGPIGPKDED